MTPKNAVSRSGAAASAPAESNRLTGRTAFLMEGAAVKGSTRVAPITKWLTADGNSRPSDVVRKLVRVYIQRTVYIDLPIGSAGSWVRRATRVKREREGDGGFGLPEVPAGAGDAHGGGGGVIGTFSACGMHSAGLGERSGFSFPLLQVGQLQRFIRVSPDLGDIGRALLGSSPRHVERPLRLGMPPATSVRAASMTASRHARRQTARRHDPNRQGSGCVPAAPCCRSVTSVARPTGLPPSRRREFPKSAEVRGIGIFRCGLVPQ